MPYLLVVDHSPLVLPNAMATSERVLVTIKSAWLSAQLKGLLGEAAITMLPCWRMRVSLRPWITSVTAPAPAENVGGMHSVDGRWKAEW